MVPTEGSLIIIYVRILLKYNLLKISETYNLFIVLNEGSQEMILGKIERNLPFMFLSC